MGLLRNALDEVTHLRTLNLGNQEFELWLNKVLDILEMAFGKGSTEYERFVRAVRAFLPTYTKAERQKEYNRRLDEYETALKSIIKKYEMLEIEEKPAATAEPAEAPEGYEERQEKQPLGKENRKHLQGTPEEIAPHIVRVANEFQFPQGFSCYAEEKSEESSQFSKQFTIYRITGGRKPGVIWAGAKEEELPRSIGTITLQPLPNNKALFIAKHTSYSFDSDGSYFDSFLTGLSLEFKDLGFEKSRVKKIWQWLKSHKIRSIIVTVIIVVVTLLGTNWTIVEENFIKFLEMFR